MRLCHLSMMNLAEGSLSVQEKGILRVRTIYTSFLPTKYNPTLVLKENRVEIASCVQTQRVFSVLKSIKLILLTKPYSLPHFFSHLHVSYNTSCEGMNATNVDNSKKI